MGPNQVAMARDSKGSDLHMQTMPYKGTISTSNISGGVTDSAAGGTALACAEKKQKTVMSA
jgi:alkaline phosphatase